jgi:ATPase family associated with various cellular activities (AAA)
VAAEAIVRAEEKRGNHVLARRLRGALSAVRPAVLPSDNGTNGTPMAPSAVSELAPLQGGLGSVVLPRASRHELDLVVREWKLRRLLATKHITRRTRLMFYGPPGCGKSITARALACELELPIYVVRFDAIVGAYLGQTAVHLRQLFQFTETAPCVLLLDELDALGKRRGSMLDVGELDRIVISLMQELEHTQPAGLVVATSNLPDHLDEALWRRFDLTLRFPQPKPKALDSYGRTLASTVGITYSASLTNLVRNATSFAAAARIIESAARNLVLARKE